MTRSVWARTVRRISPSSRRRRSACWSTCATTRASGRCLCCVRPTATRPSWRGSWRWRSTGPWHSCFRARTSRPCRRWAGAAARRPPRWPRGPMSWSTPPNRPPCSSLRVRRSRRWSRGQPCWPKRGFRCASSVHRARASSAISPSRTRRASCRRACRVTA